MAAQVRTLSFEEPWREIARARAATALFADRENSLIAAGGLKSNTYKKMKIMIAPPTLPKRMMTAMVAEGHDLQMPVSLST